MKLESICGSGKVTLRRKYFIDDFCINCCLLYSGIVGWMELPLERTFSV